MFFCLFQCFEEKEYQKESKTEWNLRERDFLTEHDLGDLDPAPRNKRGGHEGGGRAPYLVGPLLLHQRTPSSYIYLCTPVRSNTELKT